MVKTWKPPAEGERIPVNVNTVEGNAQDARLCSLLGVPFLSLSLARQEADERALSRLLMGGIGEHKL